MVDSLCLSIHVADVAGVPAWRRTSYVTEGGDERLEFTMDRVRLVLCRMVWDLLFTIGGFSDEDLVGDENFLTPFMLEEGLERVGRPEFWAF